MDPDILSQPRLGRGRRLASPVRLTLAAPLGGDVDGGWWPHTACAAHELPDLIEALHEPLGGVTDISVNWTSTEGEPSLDTIRVGAAATRGPHNNHQHLMTLTGRGAGAILLVVPHLTRPRLAVMVLRLAASMPIPAPQQATETFRTADYIVRVARAESSLCTGLECRSPKFDAPDRPRTADFVPDG